MAAEMVDGLHNRKRAEADTREAQAALEVEVEGRHQGVRDIFHPSLLLLLLNTANRRQFLSSLFLY